jgi:integrase
VSKQRNPNGSGSYKKRADGRCEWIQTKDGETRSLYGKTFKELQAKVKKISDLPITSNKLKVAEWFDRWLSIYIKPLKKTATYDQYRIIYEQHIKPVIGHRRISDLQTHELQGIIAKMNEKGLATSTMKHAKKVMNGALSKAIKEKLIPFNPANDPSNKIEIPIKQAKPRKTLTVEELSKLLKAMARSRWIWSVKFLLVTGLRRGELLALKWPDVDFDNKRLTIDESNSTTGMGDTKSAKIHYVPLSDKAIQYLNGQKNMLQAEFNPVLFNDELKKSALVFPNRSGKLLRPDSYYTLLARAAKKAGIKASPHMMRHTFVYITRDSMTLKEMQAALGHEESTTTLDIYGDIINESMKQTADKIDAAFNRVDAEIDRIGRIEESKGKMGKVLSFRKAK